MVGRGGKYKSPLSETMRRDMRDGKRRERGLAHATRAVDTHSGHHTCSLPLLFFSHSCFFIFFLLFSFASPLPVKSREEERDKVDAVKRGEEEDGETEKLPVINFGVPIKNVPAVTPVAWVCVCFFFFFLFLVCI